MQMFSKAVAAALLAAFGGVAFAAQTADVGLARGNAAQAPAGRAAIAALEELSTSLTSQEGSLPEGFPFAVGDVGDLKRARIGYGYEEYLADPQALLAGASLHDAARASGTWRYVVTLDGRAVGLITLAQVEGRWQPVGFGAAQLAAEVDAVAAQQGKRGASLRFVRVLQATSDFIEATGADQRVRYAPLAAARATLGASAAIKAPSDGLVEEADFSAGLRDAVARGLTQ